MNNEIVFPYPYVIETLDQYYGLKSHSSKKSVSKDRSKKRVLSRKGSKKKFSILIATFWSFPHVGGLSNYIATLSKGLKSQGHKVDIISPNQFSTSKVKQFREIVTPNLKHFFTKRYGSYNDRILNHKRLIYVYEKMLETVDLEKYDILHAQDLFTANILGRFNEGYGKPLFYTPHGMFTSNRLKFNIIKKGSVEEAYFTELESKAIEYANHIIVLSDSFREPLIKLGAKNRNITTVITGIDYPVNQRQEKETSSKKLVITCVARLGPRKGHNHLFEALARLKKYTANVEVLIVGDGQMREALEKQKKALGLSMVKFLGSRDDVSVILSKTDIFVLPTINDSLPISIIEAMHSGTAVISTNCGGIPELIKHNKTGIIVEPGSSEELAHALKFLIINREARYKMSKNAKIHAENHLTIDNMIRKIKHVYTDFWEMN
ncbi:glycosyltransferase family 4 protein [Priestia megaterium]|jgi:glycosyltransferase involved in cell wall biosynthesis|uniref:glycosyltransferase family 4 protein n=1 Tax=Priestia megaterium TaxID=1404 RepID=UPI002453352B|nr:glycosyltransferase family 4 protein [Priestia megaterium]MDH3139289.1 glycosyltransferase family 4 protein [Priestia megaterium]MED4235860.1 glycosyltransferase family 4 protein [Priestia megaterium]